VFALPLTYDVPMWGSGSMVIDDIANALDFFMVVWLARSAHDLADPQAKAVSRGEKPVLVRAPFGWWPLPVVAVVLPLLPAAVNLAHGLPLWIGPRRAIESVFRTYLPSVGLSQLWLYFDVLVGIGGLGVLVLVAVVRRTRRFVRATTYALVLAAAVGVVAAGTTRAVSNRDPFAADGAMELSHSGRPIYPDWMFTFEAESGEVFVGISPLWYSATFLISAFLLRLLYGGSRVRRSPSQVVVTVVASVVALCFLPVTDYARGLVVDQPAPSRPRTT
jgi:hypothetical protein